MATTKTRNQIFAALAALVLLMAPGAVQPAFATRLPDELADWFKKNLPQAKIRMDGTLEFSKEDLFLPLMPTNAPPAKGKLELRDKVPSDGIPDLLMFSDGWGFIRLIHQDKLKTVPNLNNLSDSTNRRLLNSHFPSDLIVPENFFVPLRLKALAKDIAVAEPATAKQPTHEEESKPVKPVKNEHSAVFVTSPLSGKVTMLNDKTLEKISEFQTDGTPGSMANADNKLYIADQAKSRILLLDPVKGEFLGQIDLPKKSSPKGIAALPNGKLLYLSEYSTNNIDVIEVKVGKVLVRTKVAAGPSQVVITPDGNTVLVINVPAGKLTMLSTSNQKVTGQVPLGTLPNGIAITPDSRIAFVTNRVSSSLSIIDLITKKVIKTFETGLGPTGLALDAKGEVLYIANAKDNSLTLFDAKKYTRIEDIKLPLDIDFPGGLLRLPDNKHLVVTSASTPNVGIFDMEAKKFLNQPDVGHPTDQVHWMAYP